jgi:hypothetical protein
MFKITKGITGSELAKGFHMTFENGVTISVQFGNNNYCDNRDGVKPFAESKTAEICIWDKRGEYLLKEITKGWLSTDEVSEYIIKAKNNKGELID